MIAAFRRRMLWTPLGALRLHRYPPGWTDAAHSHQWAFVTLVLRGGYDDITPGGTERLRAPAVRRRAATHEHRVAVHDDGATTLVLSGRRRREWEYVEEAGW